MTISDSCDRSRGNYQRSEEHTSELQSRRDLVCRLLLEKKKKSKYISCGEVDVQKLILCTFHLTSQLVLTLWRKKSFCSIIVRPSASTPAQDTTHTCIL